MVIKTWAFFLFPCDGYPMPGEATAEMYQATYDRYLELWSNLEQWGFEGVFFAEHHFNLINLSPSPHLLIAALSQRTKTLRIGTLGEVLPMHDGRRFVEECAMLDYLTNGRLEIGIAPGAGDIEAVQAGIPSEQVRARYYSAAEVLAKALTGPTITHHDEFHALDDVPIVPGMRQSPPHNVWTTVMSAASVEWSAQRGYRICTAWLPQPVVNALAETYRTVADAAGMSTSPEMLGLRRRVFVAPTDAEANELAEAARDVIAESAGRGFETADPATLAFLMQPDDFSIGSPDTVAERLIDQCRQGGYGHVMAYTDFRLFEPDDFARSYQLIGERVAPQLEAASLDQAASGAGL
jgi:alkanesulfonate monooxygenase SsuD/methylene tetrahydromethanopterin reductase-like flavin-dependent oxidoreductase (luciferase family)